MSDGLIEGSDGICRCWWGQNLTDYNEYHDREWGVPTIDDRKIFEKICLEGFQAGLSWLTILRKRDAFRERFYNFKIGEIINNTPNEIELLMKDTCIIRHEGKIRSVLNNAIMARKLIDERGSLAKYFWSHEPDEEKNEQMFSYQVLSKRSKSVISEQISKDLKRRGWSFVGPTTIYSFMQSIGMVNDHVIGCHRREAIKQLRLEFVRP